MHVHLTVSTGRPNLRRIGRATGVSLVALGTALAAAVLVEPGSQTLPAAVAAGQAIWWGALLATMRDPAPAGTSGPCWEQATQGWPLIGGRERPLWCTLPAGHAGAHVCDDLPHGARVTWSRA